MDEVTAIEVATSICEHRKEGDNTDIGIHSVYILVDDYVDIMSSSQM